MKLRVFHALISINECKWRPITMNQKAHRYSFCLCLITTMLTLEFQFPSRFHYETTSEGEMRNRNEKQK